MNTSNYFIELIIAGIGVATWLVLFVFALWGTAWLPTDAFLGENSIGLAIIIFPFIYVIGVVTDRLVDNIFDYLFCNRQILRVYPNKEAYLTARTKIYFHSESMKRMFEYGRSRIRICRAWAFNSVLILIAGNCYFWSLHSPFSNPLGISVFFSAFFLLSVLLTYRAWRNLSEKEIQVLKHQAGLIDKWTSD